jgi:hypothetical protein
MFATAVTTWMSRCERGRKKRGKRAPLNALAQQSIDSDNGSPLCRHWNADVRLKRLGRLVCLVCLGCGGGGGKQVGSGDCGAPGWKPNKSHLEVGQTTWPSERERESESGETSHSKLRPKSFVTETWSVPQFCGEVRQSCVRVLTCIGHDRAECGQTVARAQAEKEKKA